MPVKKAKKKKTAVKKTVAKKAAISKTLKCPRDRKALERFGRAQGKFCCNTCDGFWISGASVKKDSASGIIKLPAGLLDNLKPGKSAKALKCPEDGALLCKVKSGKNVKIGEVVMDACPTCRGIWFDQTEYGHVITKKGDVPVGASVFNSVLVFLSKMDKR